MAQTASDWEPANEVHALPLQIAQNKGVPLKFLQAVTASLGAPEEYEATGMLRGLLNERADAYLHIRDRLRLRSLENPDILPLAELVTKALAHGRLRDAEELFRQAMQNELDAARLLQTATSACEGSTGDSVLTAAEYCAALAAVAGLHGGPGGDLRAAKFFSRAAEMAEKAQPDRAARYRLFQSERLQAFGVAHNDQEAKSEAYTICLSIARQSRMCGWPELRSAALNKLGEMLLEFGQGEGNSLSLQKAVYTLSKAFEESGGDIPPLERAGMLAKMGDALLSLGEREVNAENLKKAAAAFLMALREYRRENDPLLQAEAWYGFGSAMLALGLREQGTRRLKRAVEAFRKALREVRRSRAPMAWAMLQNRLGSALKHMGEREKNSALLTDAMEVFRLALEAFSELGAHQHRASSLKKLEATQDLLAQRLLW